jgi:hypothetical protein
MIVALAGGGRLPKADDKTPDTQIGSSLPDNFSEALSEHEADW